MPFGLLQRRNWTGVDIFHETHGKAAVLQGVTIHEALEQHLKDQGRRAKHRWILCNDGSGEFADYLVLEVGGNNVFLDLWHAKFSGGRPSVRLTDLQEVVAQAIKSRRWITDVGFWPELGARLAGRARPPVRLVEGSSKLLAVLCGAAKRWERLSFGRRRPIVKGRVAIVQPGLSQRALESGVDAVDQSSVQVRDLLIVFHDSVCQVASTTVLCSY